MRLFFHPGAPKCATTYLQEQIFSKLPDVACLGRPNHRSRQYQDFRTALVHAENIQNIKESFAVLVSTHCKKADGNLTLIISDETLFNTPSHMAVAERLRICCNDIEVILTTRDQRTAVPSLYQGHTYQLKGVPKPYNGLHVTFENWMDAVMQKGESRFDFYKAYQGYSGVYGRDKVHVLPFELLKQDPKRMRTTVCSILGVQQSEISASVPEKINPAPSARFLWYQSIRSNIFYGHSLTKYVPGGKTIRRILNAYLRSGQSKPPELTEKQLEWIRQTFSEGNKLLAETTNNDFIEKYLAD